MVLEEEDEPEDRGGEEEASMRSRMPPVAGEHGAGV
jgi:hypothetical protein